MVMGRLSAAICSILWMLRPMPPCMHRILPSMAAASGSQLKSWLMRFHT
jgi:hypothetical protein